MTFKKGTSGNPAGRPKKFSAKKMHKIKKVFAILLEDNLSQLQHDIDAMSPKDRLAFFVRCAEFILPKPTRSKSSEEPAKFKPFLRKWVITPVEPYHGE